ncbi:MAG: hypothetical protein NT091_01840 [Candidatus Falkowbacteria bacterium]|nr:hypothetical protein [Candidatus Falkowbacteria bacterium]
MLFVRLEDHLASTELLIFPKFYKETISLWQEGQVIACYGKISDKDNERKILANKVVKLDLDAIQGQIQRFKTEIPQKGANPTYKAIFAKNASNPLKLVFKQKFSQEQLAQLKSILDGSRGKDKVYFKVLIGSEPKIIETNFMVDNNEIELSRTITRTFDGLVEVVK